MILSNRTIIQSTGHKHQGNGLEKKGFMFRNGQKVKPFILIENLWHDLNIAIHQTFSIQSGMDKKCQKHAKFFETHLRKCISVTAAKKSH